MATCHLKKANITFLATANKKKNCLANERVLCGMTVAPVNISSYVWVTPHKLNLIIQYLLNRLSKIITIYEI